MYTVSHDYYGILGVSKNATTEEISEQYKKLMKKHHPDQFKGMRAKYQGEGDQDLLRVIDEKIRRAEEMCKLLNEAFEVLSDPIKRKQYDDQAVEPSVPLPEISVHPTRITFGSLTEGQKKSLEFTVENKGGPPAAVNIDWEGNKPDWGELVIEPDEEKVFPIKVTVKVDTTGIPSGPKDEKILVDVDGRIHMVEVFLAVTRPVAASAVPARTPTRTYSPAPSATPSPAPDTIPVPATLGAILFLVVIVIGSINYGNQLSRERSQQVAQKQFLEATATAAISVQDSRIAFTSYRDGNGEIYVMDADGSNQTRLTNSPGDDGDPAWSPDGSRIAFQSGRDGNWEIYVMNTNGSGQTRLTNSPADDFTPSWSPDGTKIAFISNRDNKYEIYIMNADGSEQTNLANDSCTGWCPSWSPDGTKIALISSRDGNGEIYVTNADGSEQTNLTNNPADDFAPAWSPDGESIAFMSTRDGRDEIYVMTADGTGVTRLTNNQSDEWDPAWSPDGTKIAFASERDGNFEIYIMNADGSEQTNLTNNPAEDRDPAWEPGEVSPVPELIP